MSDQRQRSRGSPTQLYSEQHVFLFLSHHPLTPSPVKCQFYVHLELYLCGVLTRRPKRVRFTVISSILVHLASEVFAVCFVGFTCMLLWVGDAGWALGFRSSDFRDGSVILTCLSGFRCTSFLLSTFPSTFTSYDLYP